ncbi:MAG: UDP-N-acetylmuramate--L-alanine ligase [Candidatus Omnitrophica bacterium]|nr:UDP-N-acetylmuramate--L-alanine ligase [Candidatus Omnitrophota bacterium]
MNKSYHFIGIGGIGMSGIAQLLLLGGNRVSGSDLKENKRTQELRLLGADIYLGHNPVNINGADVVVYSSAVKEDNPEFKEAKRSGLTLIKRAQALAELMVDKTVITVAGSHGKTTTTSLVSCLLLEAGLSPTVAIGGILKKIDANACMGSGKFFVAEADESDGSFLYYKPKYSIITNIDYEHFDYYKSFDKELDAFRNFIAATDRDGCLFCCNDDINLKGLIKGYGGRVVTFGLNSQADLYPKDILLKGLESEFDCIYKGSLISHFSLKLGGEHNISNALSVIALGLELGIGIEFIQSALSDYKGSARRLEVKFKDKDYTVLDDYAHHPTEIRATLKAVLNLSPKRKIVVFQPHRFTRTKLLLEEFIKSFDNADYLIITDIYPAGEESIPGIDGRSFCKKIKEYSKDKEVYFLPKKEIVGRVLEIVKPKDLIITLGAGDISRLSDEFAEKFKDKA